MTTIFLVGFRSVVDGLGEKALAITQSPKIEIPRPKIPIKK